MSREAIEEAIEVLEDASAEMLMETGDKNYYIEAIAVLRQALEQQPVEERLGYWNAVEGWVDLPEPEQAAAWVEPEFWQHLEKVNCGTAYRLPSESRQPLYTAPTKREWVGLREDEIFSILENLQTIYNRPPTEDSRIIFAQAIEAKLKEKNT